MPNKLFAVLLATVSIGALHNELLTVRRLASAHISDHGRFTVQRVTMAGTYRIAVCKVAACSPSDTTRADVWGELVLSDSALPDSMLQRFPDSFLIGAPNGCYSLRRHRSVRSLAGLEAEAVTFWARRNAMLTFTLYQSPDAAHDVSVTAIGDTLKGRGVSWETFATSSIPGDFVRAERIGPADFRHCQMTKRHVQ